jgi:hypothetical protein
MAGITQEKQHCIVCRAHVSGRILSSIYCLCIQTHYRFPDGSLFEPSGLSKMSEKYWNEKK